MESQEINAKRIEEVDGEVDCVVALRILSGQLPIQSPGPQRDDTAIVRRIDYRTKVLNAWPMKLGSIVEMPLIVEGLSVKNSEKAGEQERSREEAPQGKAETTSGCLLNGCAVQGPKEKVTTIDRW